MLGWLLFAAFMAAAGVGLWLFLRSIGRWKLDPPTSEEAKQAEARLWSTRTQDQR